MSQELPLTEQREKLITLYIKERDKRIKLIMALLDLAKSDLRRNNLVEKIIELANQSYHDVE